MENEFLAAALNYAAQGYFIFPLRPKSKVPLTTNGFKDASSDPEVIKMWWRKWPDANIGIPTGATNGFWVLDVDSEYPADWPPIGVKPTVKTARGVHFYFTYPEDQTIKNLTKIKGRDVDVRGEGGYVVAPPSIHPTGALYEFVL